MININDNLNSTSVCGKIHQNKFMRESLYDIFKRTALNNKSHPAIFDGATLLTYSELLQKVTTLQEHLNDLQVHKNTAVALQFPRCSQFVIAALAVASLDAHFVPISDLEPESRTNSMLKNVGAQLLLHLDQNGGIELVSLPPVSTPIEVNPLWQHTSYIMHTSGSTGSPKGVAIPEVALMNCLNWYAEMLDFGPGSRISHLSRPSFDFSIPELFVPLTTGGAILIPGGQISNQFFQIVDYLSEKSVTDIQMVPTTLSYLVGIAEELPPIRASFDTLRHCVCNGETLSDSLRQRFYQVFPNVTLINSYGPTEACVAVTYHICSKSQSKLPNYIGRPAPNNCIHIVDDDMKAVPRGSIGELCISGLQIGSGYVSKQMETDLHFKKIDRNHSTYISYRTGDQARITQNGLIEFLGRKDSQVKFRGVRLELGEIENTILGTNLCRDVHVAVVPSATSLGHTEQLVCFVTPSTVKTDVILKKLKDLLPPDRLPGRIISLSSLPTTPNGKIDNLSLAKLTHKNKTMPPERKLVEYIAPKKELNLLLSILSEIKNRNIDNNEILCEIGLDSLDRLDLQLGLAQHGFKLASDFYTNLHKNVGELHQFIYAISSNEALDATNSDITSESLNNFEEKLTSQFESICKSGATIVLIQCSLVDLHGINSKNALGIFLKVINSFSKQITIALPSYSLSYLENKRFLLRSELSESGLLSTYVMKFLGGYRTKHPVYSFVLKGVDADRLSKIDWWKYSPFGDESIFGEFSKQKTTVMMMGTMAVAHIHRCEWLARVPYMRFKNISGEMVFEQSSLFGATEVYVRDISGSPESHLFAVDVRQLSKLCQKSIAYVNLGVCNSAIIDISIMESELVRALQKDNLSLLYKDRMKDAQSYMADLIE